MPEATAAALKGTLESTSLGVPQPWREEPGLERLGGLGRADGVQPHPQLPLWVPVAPAMCSNQLLWFCFYFLDNPAL